jgi:hypothetical protein
LISFSRTRSFNPIDAARLRCVDPIQCARYCKYQMVEMLPALHAGRMYTKLPRDGSSLGRCFEAGQEKRDFRRSTGFAQGRRVAGAAQAEASSCSETKRKFRSRERTIDARMGMEGNATTPGLSIRSDFAKTTVVSRPQGGARTGPPRIENVQPGQYLIQGRMLFDQPYYAGQICSAAPT